MSQDGRAATQRQMPASPRLDPTRTVADGDGNTTADVPALSWSCSQQRTMEECPRARFWSAEVAPQGWRADAPEVARHARRLKTLTTLDAQLGLALHERAAECARAIRDRERRPSLLTLRQRTSAHLRYVWVSSRDRRAEWWRAPKRVPLLIDAYYGRGPTRDQAAAVRERLERGVITLDGLALWAELAACEASDILIVDSLSSYVLPDPDGANPVLVWAAPDLVMRVDQDSAWEVIDVKSGRVRDGGAFRAAAAQVTSYAVSLRHGAGVLQAGEGCRGRLILLGDGTEHEFAITANEIDAAEARIRAGALAMASLRAQADEAATAALEQAAALGLAERDVAAAVFAARRDAYPMAVDRTRCRRCPFLELCLPEMGAGSADEIPGEEVA